MKPTDLTERLRDLALDYPDKPYLREAVDEIERLRAALRDLVERWATERGYDGAIQRASALLLEHDLRSPTTEAVRSALEKP